MRLTDSDSETECNSGSVHVHQSCTSSPKSVLPLSSEGRGKKKSHCPNHFLYQKTTGLILKLDCVQEKCPEKQRQPFYLQLLQQCSVTKCIQKEKSIPELHTRLLHSIHFSSHQKDLALYVLCTCICILLCYIYF